MSHPDIPHSHPICPTCRSDLTGREKLSYFACEATSPLGNDDVFDLYEETSTLVHFLGALAQAPPLAATQYTENTHSTSPDWMDDLVHLAEELTEEAERRLFLLREAGFIWQSRGKQAAARKEG